VYDQRRYSCDPEACRFNCQVAKRIAELRIDAESVVDGIDGGLHLERLSRRRARTTSSFSASRTHPEYDTRYGVGPLDDSLMGIVREIEFVIKIAECKTSRFADFPDLGRNLLLVNLSKGLFEDFPWDGCDLEWRTV